MSEELRTQDNAITANPIFMVQQKKRIYGFDGGYTDHFVYLDTENDHVEVSEQEQREAYAKSPEKDVLVFEDWRDDQYERTGYLDHWENVQPFFTRKGAEEYIRINGHNLKSPQIFVESGFRNHEWEEVRALLMREPSATAKWLREFAAQRHEATKHEVAKEEFEEDVRQLAMIADRFDAQEVRWTPVSEKLPPIDDKDRFNGDTRRSADVLATDGKETYLAYLQYDFDEDGSDPPRWKSGEWSLDKITHWRHLPALPEK
jgi:hypothetical protein